MSLCMATLIIMVAFVSVSANTCNSDITVRPIIKYKGNMAEFFPSDIQYENQKLTIDGAEQYYFGQSVAIDGDLAIIGAPNYNHVDQQPGLAYIFSYDGSTWIKEFELKAEDGQVGDNFGHSVAISGNFAIVGAHNAKNDNGKNTGAVYIFKRVYNYPTSWEQIAKLIASDNEEGDDFGSSVSISDDVAIVGAPSDKYNNEIVGSAYIFRYDGSSWVEEDKISDNNEETSFGWSVSISGNVAIIGAIWPSQGPGDGGGLAYIYCYENEAWIEKHELEPNPGGWNSLDQLFGESVAIKDNVTIVGSPRYTQKDPPRDDVGAAYIYRYNDDKGSWEETMLLASDGLVLDEFGWSVAIDSDTAVIGAHWDDDLGTDSGSAYLFRYDGSSWGQEEDAKLLPSDGSIGSDFGYSVAINEHIVIIGAPGNGSAYVFNLAIPGDVNGDGKVNIDDIFFILGHWGEPGGPADANEDGIVNIDDIFFVLAHWS